MSTDFQNSLTGRLSGKFATNSYLNIPPHLICVVVSLHYLVKYVCSKNRHAQEIIEANFHVRLSHSEKNLKYLSGKNIHSLTLLLSAGRAVSMDIYPPVNATL